MRIAKYYSTWKRVGVHFAWLCVVAMTFYISRMCAEIEVHAANLMVCWDAYQTKSGSLLHDARLSTIYHSNRNELQRCRNGFLGGFAYWITMKCYPPIEHRLQTLEKLENSSVKTWSNPSSSTKTTAPAPSP